ncbi:MAG TPA: lipid-binding SYLF domain-containing protein [Candidatus Koribacter sp.]|jgi:lipid-binding SYLF domain-containing protein
MKKIAGLLTLLLLSGAAFAHDRSNEVDRVESSATVLDEIMSAPDSGIPNRVIDSAKCVAVVPSMLKGGFVFGAAYGRGIASCRSEKGGWTPPAFFVLEGGSFGLQIGGQAVDVVMLVMNDHGMRNLLTSKFKLGADASVAAGPVGRQASGDTDLYMRAEILTYSRARGIFAGLTLNGASVRQDRDATRDFYGHYISYRTLLRGETEQPQGAETWITALNRYAGGSTNPGSGTTASAPLAPPPQAPAPAAAPAPANPANTDANEPAPSATNTPPAAKMPAENDIPDVPPQPASADPH